ncbi:MAG: hypothetical protein CM1200mP30_00580 [Pseudomonadota bacterium]|nr:MAG: hypothetical protein CM1200mP30_00580 [Pseudomonadota bacterium]
MKKGGETLDFAGMVLEHCFQCASKNNGESGLWIIADFTAAESGLDPFIDWNKDFIGKNQLKEKPGR